MAVSKRTRYEVLRRDNHQCRYCGATAPKVELTIDHVTPVSLGGSDDPSNLVAACRDCNAGKASSNPDAPLVATISDDQIRWSKALEVAAAEMLADREALHERTQAFFDEWDKWRNGGQPLPLPESWRSSVDRWLAVGLPLRILCDDIDIAMGRSKVPPSEKFAYVAGIAWNQVRELQSKASSALADDDQPLVPAGCCPGCEEPLTSSGFCFWVDATGQGKCFECTSDSAKPEDHVTCCELRHAKTDSFHFGFRVAREQDMQVAHYYDVVARFIDGDHIPKAPVRSASYPYLPPYLGKGGQREALLHEDQWYERVPGAALRRVPPVKYFVKHS